MNRKELRILVLTSIIPIQEIKSKTDENNIIILNGDAVEKKFDDIIFHYGFIFPKSNKITSLLSSKWKAYFDLSLKKSVLSSHKNIFLFPIIILPKFKQLNKILGDLSFFLNRKRIEEFLQLHNPNLVHAHSIKADGYLAYKIYKKYNIPYILTIREFSSKNILPEVIENAKKIISINAVDRTMLRTMFNIEAEFLPHGVPEKFFKKKTHNDAGKIKFLIVSRLLPLKNIDKIIKALSKINHDYVFDIYGEGVEFQKLKKLIEDHNLENKIKLKGYISNDELSNLYSLYDVFVMPSKPEALGRVYFEAMASGLPVIAAKFTGVDGIVENGKEGFLVDIDQQQELENCLQTILKDPNVLTEMSSNAVLLANKFKLSEIVKKSYEVYL